jgi:hypothetical protein
MIRCKRLVMHAVVEKEVEPSDGRSEQKTVTCDGLRGVAVVSSGLGHRPHILRRAGPTMISCSRSNTTSASPSGPGSLNKVLEHIGTHDGGRAPDPLR